MAEKPPNKSIARVKNMVHDDAIWRQMIEYELATSRNWETTWGFMKDMYENIASKNDPGCASKSTLPPLPKGITPSGLPVRSADHLENEKEYILSYRIHDLMKRREPLDKYTFPATTSTEVGWRWKGRPATINEDAVKRIHHYERSPKFKECGRRNTFKWWGGTLESLP